MPAPDGSVSVAGKSSLWRQIPVPAAAAPIAYSAPNALAANAAPVPVSVVAVAAPIVSVNPAERREQKRVEAEQRQKNAAQRKPIETRIKRLEEQIEKINTKKSTVESKLAEATIYEASRKNELQSLLSDQAYCSKELAELEGEWMIQLEALEKISL